MALDKKVLGEYEEKIKISFKETALQQTSCLADLDYIAVTAKELEEKIVKPYLSLRLDLKQGYKTEKKEQQVLDLENFIKEKSNNNYHLLKKDITIIDRDYKISLTKTGLSLKELAEYKQSIQEKAEQEEFKTYESELVSFIRQQQDYQDARTDLIVERYKKIEKKYLSFIAMTQTTTPIHPDVFTIQPLPN